MLDSLGPKTPRRPFTDDMKQMLEDIKRAEIAQTETSTILEPRDILLPGRISGFEGTLAMARLARDLKRI
jgi:hypothetical protein